MSNKQSICVPIVWTLDQASDETGLTKFTLINLVKSGKVRYIRVGAGKRGKILINAQSLCDYMQGVSE